MRKFIMALVLEVFVFLGALGLVNAQTETPTPTATPTSVPAGSPTTGYGTM